MLPRQRGRTHHRRQPQKPQNLFVTGGGGVDGQGNGGLGAYSFDGGATWQLVNGGNIGSGNGSAGDGLPQCAGGNFTAAFDQFGNLFVTYAAANSSGQHGSEIAVVWSTDGGKTFSLLIEYAGNIGSTQGDCRSRAERLLPNPPAY